MVKCFLQFFLRSVIDGFLRCAGNRRSELAVNDSSAPQTQAHPLRETEFPKAIGVEWGCGRLQVAAGVWSACLAVSWFDLRTCRCPGAGCYPEQAAASLAR